MRKLAFVLPLLLAACAGIQDLARSAVKTPKLTFRSASVQALNLDGATVAFTWDLENPNGFGVDLARVGWSVEVEGKRVAAGDLPGGLKIVANGTVPVTFPVRVRFQDVPGIVALLGSGKDVLHYKLGGTIGVGTPIGILDLPLSHEDQLRLPSLPRFALDGVSIRSVGFTEIALDVRVRVRNPNAFPLPVGQLEYALAIGGAPVARADAAGRAAADLARGGEVQVDLTGKASLAGIPIPLELKGRVPARR